ncbi:MAG: hypothetical protein ACO3DV_06415, partial [Ilumatobacteraceae bacterium]
ESFGRLVDATVVVGAPLATLEFDALVEPEVATLVVLTATLVVVELDDEAATVVTTTVGATVDATCVAVSLVVVTKVSLND